jgi:hypothetical protein
MVSLARDDALGGGEQLDPSLLSLTIEAIGAGYLHLVGRRSHRLKK